MKTAKHKRENQTKDDLRYRRQKKCAESAEGHQWSDPDAGNGVCSKCGLEILAS